MAQDIFASRSRLTLQFYHEKHHQEIKQLDLKELLNHINVEPILTSPQGAERTPVCIIGAGVAGLYAGMILKSLGIPFKILELSGRVGGRLYTYKNFHSQQNFDEDYQYYDVGAMRFPRTPFMKRTFDLVDFINKEKPGRLKWIPYIFKSKETFMYYNGVRIKSSDKHLLGSADPFRINVHKPAYISPGYERLLTPDNLEAELWNIMHDLKKNFIGAETQSQIDAAMAKLIHDHDKDSMRSYLTNDPRYKMPSEVIQLLETFDKSTGWYDRGLVESVCESLAFQWTNDKDTLPDYFCFDKGSSELALAMEEYVGKTQINFNTRITAISYADKENPMKGLSVEGIHSNGTVYRETFSGVICTTPISTLNLIDLTGCGINENYAQYSAIRELQYGPAIKIGIQFSRNWWEKLGIVGGQSYTDLPLRTVVYPSYPEKGSKSNVLIASYCWTQDAERLGSLIDNEHGKMSPLLESLVLKDLATIHDIPVQDLKDMVLDSYAFDWLHNPSTQGGYAFFGPQQFSDKIYTEMTQPAAQGQLYFAGEALSTCHAWVAGALNSVTRAVDQFLLVYKSNESDKKVIHKFHEQWGKPWGESEYWTKEQLDNQLALGLARSGVL